MNMAQHSAALLPSHHNVFVHCILANKMPFCVWLKIPLWVYLLIFKGQVLLRNTVTKSTSSEGGEEGGGGTDSATTGDSDYLVMVL